MAAPNNKKEYGYCMGRKVDTRALESYRYYLSLRTVLEMLNDRGYDIPSSQLSRSLAEFRSIFGDKPDIERLRFDFPLRSKPSKKMLVLFLGTDEVKTQTVRHIFGQILNRENIQGLMLILQSKMTPIAKNEVKKCPFKVEIFQITDLLVNITKHILQPKHEILTAAEKHILLKKYMLEDEQLPRMLENDAIARYYGLEKGQLVKLTYSDGFADSLETYRCIQ
ncbi:hypothetical protein Patl1_05401 [Pistacia atlantica]|uniref:Uncharacterized protein n=1 Tax=Pistacia atlantica TaxID=434234 RepID=A0ACC1BQQ6_9ROSI|nr:hypothetical protein Patl1_05401 [Pistacia atlantica]